MAHSLKALFIVMLKPWQQECKSAAMRHSIHRGERMESYSEIPPFNPHLRNNATPLSASTHFNQPTKIIPHWHAVCVLHVLLESVKLITSINHHTYLTNQSTLLGFQGSCFGLLSILFICHMIFCVKQYIAYK